jgi:uncharacterized protein YcaQ
MSYREGDLLRHVHEEHAEAGRRAFEQYLPEQGILAVFPAEAWPHLVPHQRRRAQRRSGYAGRLSRAEEQVARLVLDELKARGPLTSDDIEHEGRARTGWGSRSRLVKTVLDKLLVHGRVLISERRQFRRVYDLPERVLPTELLAYPEPSATENQRWLILQRLRQRRLVTLKRADALVIEDLIIEAIVPDCPRLFFLREDLALIDGRVTEQEPVTEPRLLAPLDPLIYDRRLTASLWDFDYTWEVYTPPARRRCGYYALPVLSARELVGSVDPRADREDGTLLVVRRRVKRGHKTAAAVRELATFLGLRGR